MYWREVKKEKPQEMQYVIVYARGGRMLMSLYKNDIFWCYDLISEHLEKIDKPTHWMPQPQKPIGFQEGNLKFFIT